jgi:hypothetical protein
MSLQYQADLFGFQDDDIIRIARRAPRESELDLIVSPDAPLIFHARATMAYIYGLEGEFHDDEDIIQVVGEVMGDINARRAINYLTALGYLEEVIQ